MSFDFKQALENLKVSKTIEEQVEDFLQLIALHFQSKNIKRDDIDTIYFTLKLTEESIPLLYKAKAAYTLKNENHFKETKYYLICSFGDYKYAEASCFMQIIKQTLENNGIEYDDNYVIDISKSNFREPFSIKC